MNKTQQSEHFDNMISRMKSIMISKSQDYTQEVDVLSNFKLAGNICGLSPELNCLSLIATKVARLGALLKSGNAPNNESIRDSILDLGNYTILLDMIRAERESLPRLATQEEATFATEPLRDFTDYKGPN